MTALRRMLGVARAFSADASGASAMVFALLLTVILGFVGLGVDVGVWRVNERRLQGGADAAALSGAVALAAGGADPAAEAAAVLHRHGLRNGVDSVTAQVSVPPGQGPYAGDPRAVEVVVSRPAPRIFAGLFLESDPMIRARAVAKAGAPATACVVALSSTASASALETGSANVKLSGCSLVANSTSPTAFQLKGAASFEAESVHLVGGYSISANATLTLENGMYSGAPHMSDPYADVEIPAYSGCDYNGANLTSGTYGGGAPPLVFCNGLTLNSGVTITLNPGVYVIDRGALRVNGGAVLRGDGVTLVLTSSSGTDYATLQISGGATVDLSAPTSGPTAGLVVMQDRRAPAGVRNTLTGGSTQVLEGAVYLPNQILTFTGGSIAGAPDGCTQLVVAQAEFRGDTGLGSACEGTAVRRIGAIPSRLVE